jgi:hypothetical protein
VSRSKTALWKALRTMHVGEDRMLRLPDSVRWSNSAVLDTPLYVRTAYENLYDVLSKAISKGTRRIVVSGVPGIGKSSCAYYFLWRYVQSVTPVTVLFESGDLYSLYHTDGNVYEGSHGEMAQWFEDTSVYRFVDRATRTPPVSGFDGVSIVWSSPDPERYKEFLKGTHSALFYTPPWSFDELKALHSVAYETVSPELLRSQYDIYGGVPRFVLSKASDGDTHAQHALNKYGDHIQCMIEEVAGGWNSNTVDKSTSYTLVHIVPKPRDFKQRRLLWASDWVVQHLSQQWSKEVRRSMLNFMHGVHGIPDAAALVGKLFECFAHTRIIKLGLPDLKPLLDPKADGEGDVAADAVACIPPLESRIFRNVEDLTGKKVQEKVYYQPSVTNMASGDSFVLIDKCLFILQMTVAKKHDVKVKGLRAIYNVVASEHVDVNRCHLVFVVPLDTAAGFQHQNYLTTGGTVFKRLPTWFKATKMTQWVGKCDYAGTTEIEAKGVVAAVTEEEAEAEAEPEDKNEPREGGAPPSVPNRRASKKRMRNED